MTHSRRTHRSPALIRWLTQPAWEKSRRTTPGIAPEKKKKKKGGRFVRLSQRRGCAANWSPEQDEGQGIF